MLWILVQSTTGIKWTEVVSAGAAVGSALIAAIAAMFAYKAYLKQSGQLELSRQDSLRWHSSKFALWVEWDQDRVSQPPLAAELLSQFRFYYINASDLPVHQVLAKLELKYPELNCDVEYTAYFGRLNPGDNIQDAGSIARNMSRKRARKPGEPEAAGPQWFDLNEILPPDIILPDQINGWLTEHLTVEFVDNSGVRWRRSGNGTLESIDSSESIRPPASDHYAVDFAGNTKSLREQRGAAWGDRHLRL